MTSLNSNGLHSTKHILKNYCNFNIMYHLPHLRSQHYTVPTLRLLEALQAWYLDVVTMWFAPSFGSVCYPV